MSVIIERNASHPPSLFSCIKPRLLPSQYGPCPLSHLIFIGMQCNFECKMLIIDGTKTYLPDEDDDQILDAERINLYQQMTGCIMYCSLVRPELM